MKKNIDWRNIVIWSLGIMAIVTISPTFEQASAKDFKEHITHK